MASVNLVILQGVLQDDVKLRYTQQGLAMANFQLRTWAAIGKEADGKTKYVSEWHNILVTGKDAENASKYLKKDSECYIEGKKQTREWTDKEGQKRYTTEIISRDVRYASRNQQQEHDVGNYDQYPR